MSSSVGRQPSRPTCVARLLALIVAVALLVGACGSEGPQARPSPVASATGPSTDAKPPSLGGGGARLGPGLVPDSGVLVGASVQAEGPGDAARLAAVEDFEAAVGRRLDLVHTYLPFDREFPSGSDAELLKSSRELLVSWNGMDMARVAAGADDTLIRSRARAMRDAGNPLWLMFRGEMDRPNLRATVPTPELYVQAYRHVRDLFREEGANQVSWVWCPTSKGFDEGRAAAYYPGDGQVDWLCSDIYPGPNRVSFDQAAQKFLDFARAHPQPVMIGEFGISEGSGDRAAWLAGVASTVRAQPQIKALSYFNGNNDQKGQAAQLSLLSSPAALRAFHELLADPHFNPAGWPLQEPRG